MSLILDAGALVAVERRDELTTTLIKHELAARRAPRSHGGVIGQVWRDGGRRQPRLAKLLPAVKVFPLDEALGRRAGALLARAHRLDVVDAALVLLAVDGDFILTSEPDDLAPLAFAAGLQVEIVRV